MENEERLTDSQEATIAATKKQQEVIVSYQKLFDSEDGQIVLHDMMKVFHFYTTTGGATPEETHFNEGQRSVVLSILQILKADSKQYSKYIQSIKENTDVTFFNYAENRSK